MRLILIAFLLIPIQLISQANQVVKGQVLDQDIESPLIGATVSIISTAEPLRTITDFDDHFRFDAVPVGRHDVVGEYLGFKANNLTNLQIELSIAYEYLNKQIVPLSFRSFLKMLLSKILYPERSL